MLKFQCFAHYKCYFSSRFSDLAFLYMAREIRTKNQNYLILINRALFNDHFNRK